MALPDTFTKEVSEQLISRIEQLGPDTAAKWGRMDVAQMLAHCNVTYELIYEDKHPKPNPLMRFILKAFIKKTVCNEVPYKHHAQTAPAFVITGSRDFEKEKNRLVAHIRQTRDLGAEHFDHKLSHSFGNLRLEEWNNMFYKHLDHHLQQFGV